MSFGKAKRFIYKLPDVDSSPADYLLSTSLEKGCSIPKSDRFKESKSCSGNSSVCCRLSNSYSSKGENKFYTKYNKNVTNERVSEFNRNDAMRKTFRAEKKNRKIKLNKCNNHHENSIMKKIKLCEANNFFDDDYESIHISPEELDNLKNLEEYELNEVYNAMRRFAVRNCHKTNSCITKNIKGSNFEDIVLKKLESIDKNVKIIKEDVASLPQAPYEELHYKLKTGETHLKHFHPSHIDQEEMRNIITRTIQKLGTRLENKRKSVLKDREEHILNIITEMHSSNKESNKEIKELCNSTTEELVQSLCNILENPMYEYADENEIENIFEQLKIDCFTEEVMAQSDHSPTTSDYSEPALDDQEFEEDISDITLKCMDTQHMLDAQGALLDAMKGEIEDLKSSFYKS